MSFCRAEEIGAGATAQDVKAVAELLELYGIPFYTSASWFIGIPAMIWLGDKSYLVDSMRRVISLDTVVSGNTNLTVEKIDGRVVTLNMSSPMGNLSFTGVYGVATMQELLAGDTIKAGDTIIRSGDVLFQEADSTAQAGDTLLVPPELLRQVAITIGRRLAARKLSEKADGMDTTVLEDMQTTLGLYL